MHRSNGVTPAGQRRFLINFSSELASELKAFSHSSIMDCFGSATPCLQLSQSQAKEISELLLQMLELSEDSPFADYYKKTYLCNLLILLSSAVKSETNTLNGTISEWIIDVARYLERHYRENLTLEQIAEEFHISPCYLSRCFKKYMGIRLIQYLNNLRIIFARHMLEENQVSITEVALKSGFESITHFERIFRSLTGTAPKKYQQQFRK